MYLHLDKSNDSHADVISFVLLFSETLENKRNHYNGTLPCLCKKGVCFC